MAQIRKHFMSLFLLGMVCFSSACKKEHHSVTRGFYYWKTIYRPSTYELTTLHKLGVHKMYIRFFDVDWQEQTQQSIPVAPIQLPAHADTALDYVPVVFVTQKMLANLRPDAVEPLAKKIAIFLESLCSGASIKPSEIQIDCDWTSRSKNAYFALLTELKRQDYFKGKILSCTIRMHQVKYTVSSGVPPADKGMLMCYSMGDIKKPGARNSILDAGEAKDYLKRIRMYSLPLDIALPLFEWCVLFREQEFRGILHDVTTAEVKASGLFSQKQDNLYTCPKDTTWHGYQLKANDIIRLETPSYKDILSVANFSSQQIINKVMNVVLFACDSITLSKYSPDELEDVYNTYR